MRKLLKGLFTEHVEHSLTLRVVALALTWWSGAALGLVGAAAWAWLGGPLLASAGHYASWRLRRRSIRALRWLVISLVLGLTAFLALELRGALNGNWLPAAQYLALTLGIASFDLRTRGGLYTVILLSGTIIFLTSQLAFGSTFLVILAGFFVLFSGFLVAATTADALVGTVARLGWSRLAKLASWSAWGAAILGIGLAIFIVTPWGNLKNGAGLGGTEALLPLTGQASSGQSSAPGDSTEAQPRESVDPVTPTQQTSGPEGGQPATPLDGATAPADASQVTPGGAPSSPLPSTNFDTALVDPVQDDVILRVRSPVASYWRVQVHTVFDGTRWRPDPSVHLEPRLGRGLPGRYAQTYYVAEDRAMPALGYSPVDWEIVTGSAESRGLEEGTVYQVLSQRRPFTPRALRFLSRGVASSPTRFQGISPDVRALADEIIGSADNLFDKSILITCYLRDNYRFDPRPERQHILRPVEQFLFREERQGNNYDFAAAQAVLSRAVGLESRVVSGYLPGEFDPLSGTYTVRRRDAHTWSEVRFPFVGWVPFDASPRTDLPVASGGPGVAGRIVNELFDLQIGQDVQDGFTSISSFLAEHRSLTAGIGLLISSLTLLWWFAIRKDRGTPRRHRAPPYSLLRGTDRQALLAWFRRLEKALRRYDVPPRAPAETLAAYFARANTALPHLGPGLHSLQRAFSSAAYGPTGPSPADVAAVKGQVRSLHR